jgi:hypothetical protein
MFTHEIKGFGRESRRVERASYDYLRLVNELVRLLVQLNGNPS